MKQLAGLPKDMCEEQFNQGYQGSCSQAAEDCFKDILGTFLWSFLLSPVVNGPSREKTTLSCTLSWIMKDPNLSSCSHQLS